MMLVRFAGSRWASLIVLMACWSGFATTPKPLWPAEPSVPVSAANGLMLSATVVRDRELEARFRQAQDHITRGEFGPGVTLLAQLTQTDAAVFVLIEADGAPASSEFYRGLQHAVRVVLEKLPPEVMRLYRQQVDPVANERVAMAIKANDVDALQRVVRQFPLTDAELRALQTLGAKAADVAQFDLARTVGHRIREHSLLTTQEATRVKRWQTRIEGSPSVVERTPNKKSDRGAAWHVAEPLSVDASAMLQEGLREHDEQSIPLLPRAKPLIVGETVLTRLLGHVSAHDLATGRELWSSSKRADDVSSLPSNPSLHTLAKRSLARQWQLDSIVSGMTRHRDLVVTVEPTQTRFHSIPGPTLRSKHAPGQNRTQLHARLLTTGQSQWTCNGTGIATDAAGLGAEFLGPPSGFDRELWGVAQVDASLVVYAVDSQSGSIIWSQRWGEASRAHAADSDWRAIAAPLGMFADQFVCVTGAGLILAVDPVTRVPTWAWRYSRDDAPPEAIPFIGAVPGSSTRHWWKSWRETSLTLLDSAPPRLLIASPDRRELIALDRSGHVAWRKPIVDGMYVAGVDAQRVLVLTKHKALSLDAVSGALLATRPIPTATGSGSWDATRTRPRYVFPSTTGLCEIDVELKDIAFVRAASALPSGNVTCVNGACVLQSLSGVERLSLVTESSGRASLQRGLDMPTRLAELEFEATRWRERLAEVELISASEPRKLEALLSVARAARAQGDLLESLAIYLQLGELNATHLRTTEEFGAWRQARFDRVLAAEMTELLQSQPGPDGESLRQRLATALDQARRSPDPFAVQRFTQRYAELPGLRHMAFDRQARIGQSYSQSLLPLLSRAGSTDERLAVTAILELAAVLQSRSYDDDLRAVIEQTAHLDVSNSSDAEGKSLVAQLTELRQRFTPPRRPFWPMTRPTVTETELAVTKIGFMPVPVEASPGSLFARLDVSWHSSGTQLRFTGDGRGGDWTLNLPTAASMPLRSAVSLARGWGVGQALILRLGSELFAISPFDENGEQRAKLLWSLNMLPSLDLQGRRLLPARLGFADQQLQFLDPYDRPLGQVDPVTPSYLCYQNAGRLTCVETMTGQVRWQRGDLPAEAQISGDDLSVFLTDPIARTVVELRALDGASLGECHLPDNVSVISQTRHRQIRRLGVDALQGIDLRANQPRWTRELSAGDLFFAVNQDTLGVCAADGDCTLLDTATGREQLRFHIDRPAKVEFLLCLADADKCLMVVSGPCPHRTAETQFEALLRRNPLVDGHLTAIDRRTGKRLWSRPLSESNFFLDQPQSMPFVVVISHVAPTGGQQLDLLDSRNGETLYTYRSTTRETYPLFRLTQPLPSASMRLSSREVRIEYSPSAAP